MNGASQALDGPVVTAAIEHPHDIVPTVLGPELPYHRQPRLRGRNELIEIAFLARFGDGLDCLRSPFSQAGVSGKLAARLRRLDAGFGAFGDQRPLELGDRAENLEGEHALWRRGVDRVADRPEMHAALLEVFYHRQEMTHRSGQPIEADNDEDVARGELAKHFGQDWARARCPGAVLLIDPIAAGGPQLIDLGIVDLVVGRDAGVADLPLEGLWDVNGLSLRHRAFNGLVSKCFVQIRNALEIAPLQACFMM
ncbi:hypothetical protein D9M68_391130 [compost metagenome]